MTGLMKDVMVPGYWTKDVLLWQDTADEEGESFVVRFVTPGLHDLRFRRSSRLYGSAPCILALFNCVGAKLATYDELRHLHQMQMRFMRTSV